MAVNTHGTKVQNRLQLSGSSTVSQPANSNKIDGTTVSITGKFISHADCQSILQLIAQDWPLVQFGIVQNSDKTFSVVVLNDNSAASSPPFPDGAVYKALVAVPNGAMGGVATLASATGNDQVAGSGKGTLNNPGGTGGVVNNGAGGATDLNQAPNYTGGRTVGGAYAAGTANEKGPHWTKMLLTDMVVASGTPAVFGAKATPKDGSGTLDNPGGPQGAANNGAGGAAYLAQVPVYPMGAVEGPVVRLDATASGISATIAGRVPEADAMGDFTDVFAGV